MFSVIALKKNPVKKERELFKVSHLFTFFSLKQPLISNLAKKHEDPVFALNLSSRNKEIRLMLM